MSAIGQPAGAAPAAPGPGTPAPAPAAQPGANTDPFGFAQHVQGAPEHLRPYLQSAFDQVSPTLNQRLERFAPIEPHLDTLSPLLQADENGGTPLEGLASLYSLFTDESRVDELADWWDAVGEQFGFFEEDGSNEGVEPAPAGAPGEIDLNAIEDPGLRGIVQAMQQQNQQLQAKLGEFENTLQTQSQQTQIQQTAERIKSELQQHMKAAGIEGHENLNSPNAVDVMRIAASYGEDPQAIEKAVADYARMTGRTPAAAVNPALGGAAALEAALGSTAAATAARPGSALGAGQPAAEPEHVQSWGEARDLAMQRLTAQ